MHYLPNIVTFLRMGLLVPYLYSLWYGYYAQALYLFLIAGLSDGIDGFLARRFRWTSQLGAFIDPLADKLLMMGSLVVLHCLGFLPFWALFLLVLRDVIIMSGVVYIYYYHRKHLKFQPILTSKWNTFLQITLVFVLLFQLNYGSILPEWALNGLVGLVIVTSFISLIQYVALWSKQVSLKA